MKIKKNDALNLDEKYFLKYLTAFPFIHYVKYKPSVGEIKRYLSKIIDKGFRIATYNLRLWLILMKRI